MIAKVKTIDLIEVPSPLWISGAKYKPSVLFFLFVIGAPKRTIKLSSLFGLKLLK
jgi:hypothetical protein